MKKLLNIFKRQSNKINKSNLSTNKSFTNFAQLMRSSNSVKKLTDYDAQKFYCTCSAVYTAVRLLSSEIASLKPVVFDKKSKKFIEHPVLELLANPNKAESFHLFINSIASTLIATGNSFLISEGKINRPPISLNHYSSAEITIEQSAIDKFPQSYRYNGTNYAETFDRLDLSSNKKYIYVNSEKNSEIYQSRTYSPYSYDLFGISPLSAVFIEILQLNLSNLHNLSSLEKGGRPSGLLHTPLEISDDLYRAYQKSLNDFYAGAGNAGRIMITSGLDFKYEELSQSAKDMDFLKLKENITEAIYNALQIPLPMISGKQMTYANMEASRLNLYDNAVLPWADKIFEDFTSFLMPKYGNNENLVITYNIDEIDALKLRRNQELSTLNSLNVLTVNEIRAMLGKEAIEGGDSIYQPQTLTAFANDVDTQDNIQPNLDSDKSIDNIINTLKNQKKPDGTPFFKEKDFKPLSS